MVKRKVDIERAARRFLRTGTIGRSDPSALAVACDKLIRGKTQHSIHTALELSTSFLTYSRRNKQLPLQLACRTHGWVLLVAGKYRQAEKAYLQARALVASEPITRARIDRILIDVYMYLEDFSQARRHAQLALNTFTRKKELREAAMTRVNYGNLFHRLDRHQEAYDQYDRARKVLERGGGELALALTYYNLANASVQLFKFDQAGELYLQARARFSKLGYALYVNESDYGLAWLKLLQGDYPQALERLIECEKIYVKTGQMRGAVLCQLDRAEAYLALNLFQEAADDATRAIKGATRLKLVYESAKGSFFHALATRAMGQAGRAQKSLSQAIDGFTKARNHGFVAAARVLDLTAEREAMRNPNRLKKLRDNFIKSQLPLWEAICDINLLSVLPDDRSLLQRLRVNRAIQAVPHLKSLWKTYLGDREAQRGQINRAQSYWTEAAELLEAVRAKLPPIEIRSALNRSSSDPLARLVDTKANGEPAVAAAWSERLKTTGPWAPPTEALARVSGRIKIEQNIARLAAQVTALSARIDKPSARSTRESDRMTARVSRLQTNATDQWHKLERSVRVQNSVSRQLLNEIALLSERQPIIQFHCSGNDLIAFVHDQGETRIHRYPNGNRLAAEFAGCWSVSLSRRLLTPGRASQTDLQEETRLFTNLGDWLWAPLELPAAHKKVLIIPEGRLSNIPWLALIHNGLPLADSHRITVSPSIRHHQLASSVKVRSHQAAVFIGRSDGLKAVNAELSVLRDASLDLEIFRDCQHKHWPTSGEAYLWHYTGHANYRSDNPFYSSLELHDRPLYANEFRTMNNRVALVTLAACRTGYQSILPGEESTGLVRSLIEMGARNVVGSHWSVADKTTSVWMRHFYKQIFDHKPVSEAVRLAAINTRKKYRSAYDWAAFSAFGAG